MILDMKMTGKRMSKRKLLHYYILYIAECKCTKVFLLYRMKEVDVANGYRIIVYYSKGLFHAFGSKCPHKGSPLILGTIVDGTIKCSVHGSEFDIETGTMDATKN